MATYDTLPAPLRHWLTQAALPWSPISCRRIWQRARNTGASVDEALEVLNRAEKRAIEREYVLPDQKTVRETERGFCR